MIFDALSRLISREYRLEIDELLDALIVHCYSVSLIELSPNFRRRILKGYQKPRWTWVLQTVRDNEALGENAAKLSYRIVDKLLYFNNDEKGLRLCVSSALEVEIFKLTHDEMRYSGYARTHERLTKGLYIFDMIIKLHEFIRHCSNCQLNQTSRHISHDSL